MKKLTGGFDNGLGAVLIGELSLASFLSKKSREGISGLFQQYRSTALITSKTSMSARPPIGASFLLVGKAAYLGYVVQFAYFRTQVSAISASLLAYGRT